MDYKLDTSRPSVRNRQGVTLSDKWEETLGFLALMAPIMLMFWSAFAFTDWI
jgi:hypothetical protein